MKTCTKKIYLHLIILLFGSAVLCASTLEQQFRLIGCAEFDDPNYQKSTYDILYTYFDEMIEFLQTHPNWKNKLHIAKEHFIRTKDKELYSTDFFGLYDESNRIGRHQISYYYSTHYHAFITARYPELNQIPEIINFLNACNAIQEPCGQVFKEAAVELGIETIFLLSLGSPPILLKVVKYFPTYHESRPHYDGSAFSLFLDSTDYTSLYFAPYKTSLSVNDFAPVSSYFLSNSPFRLSFEQTHHTMLMIPGALLEEFSIYPTPHIALANGKMRYSTIAFALRPHHKLTKNNFTTLPVFEATLINLDALSEND